MADKFNYMPTRLIDELSIENARDWLSRVLEMIPGQGHARLPMRPPQSKNRFGLWYDFRQRTRHSAVGRPARFGGSIGVPKGSTLGHCTLSGKHHQIDEVGHPLDLTTRGLTDAEGALGVFYRPSCREPPAAASALRAP